MYWIVFVLLITFLLGYFRLADHFNIIDKPNGRSSHTAITIRGGGVVFPFATILYWVIFQDVSITLLGGLLLISLISFWDDVLSLPNKGRILVHMVAVSLMLFSVGAFHAWPLWLVLLSYILIIGTINAYNFMDGINGVTGIYSLITLAGLLYLNERVVSFADPAFIIFPLIACLVFLFFNFRKKAKCFAGDVGSVSIGFWIISLLLMVIYQTGNLEYILFLGVYGVDTVLTIVHRLVLKQNIFKAHRLHFYQIMANERGLPHLIVSSIYGIVQLVINVFVVTSEYSFFTTSIFVLVPLAFVYIFLKPKWMPKTVLV